MKGISKILITSGLVLGLCGFPSVAQGQKQKRTPEEVFARMDKNNDKKISLEEFIGRRAGDKAAKAKDQFKKRDQNNDGFLTLDEFKAGQKKR